MTTQIPYTLAARDLRAAADRYARSEGYRVKALPSVSVDRTLVVCTYLAEDGVAFQRYLTAEQVLSKTIETEGTK